MRTSMQNLDFLHLKQVCEGMCKFTSCLKYANPSNPNVCRSGMSDVSKVKWVKEQIC
jgi:hypothetical protein